MLVVVSCGLAQPEHARRAKTAAVARLMTSHLPLRQTAVNAAVVPVAVAVVVAAADIGTHCLFQLPVENRLAVVVAVAGNAVEPVE